MVLVFLIVALAQATWSAHKKMQYAQSKKEKAYKELAQLKKRSQALKEAKEVASTERGLEMEIRSRFDVGHKGEKMIVLLDAPEAPQQKPEPPKTLWQKIRAFFSW